MSLIMATTMTIAVPYALLSFVLALLHERHWLGSLSNNIDDGLSSSAALRLLCDAVSEAAVMAMTGLDLAAQLLASGRADGGCLALLFLYSWLLVYPAVFFKSVRESKPLIESTQQSVADLDLFFAARCGARRR